MSFSCNIKVIKFLYLSLMTGMLIAQPIFGFMSLDDNQSDNNNQSDDNSSQPIVKDVCFSIYPMLCVDIKPPIDIEFPLIDIYPDILPIGVITPEFKISI